MLFSDTYKTIERSSEAIFRDRGSKFIGYAFPIRDEDEIKEILNKMRTEHPKARHYCWAFRLTPDRSVFRVNDDGEPAGSAGRQILNALLSADLTNILVVVVRYFGGTLLGVAGLINAYKTATIECLKVAKVIVRTVNDLYQILFEYHQLNHVMKIVKEEGLHTLEQRFDNNCSIEFEVRKAEVNRVIGRFEKIPNLSIKYIQTS